ncbi:MAG: ATP-binding protein, partial [Actinobacteria bacterium]|nr:ATP-binding protein [Actinomycetota bacterium]
MLDDDLAEIISKLRAQGADDADVEAKRAERKLPKGLRSTLSAFANTRGGVLILGLDEATGLQANGVADPAKIASDLASLCSTDFEPPIRPLIRVHRFEDVDLVVAEIPEMEPGQKPCYHLGSGIAQGSYIRVGDGDRRLTGYEIQMLLAKRGQPREDEQQLTGVGPEHLDPSLIEAFVFKVRQRRIHAFTGLDT